MRKEQWMKEMEYLTERDIEYFRKQAENGEAVIIELDPEVLLRLNLSDIMKPDRAEPLSEEEIKNWLEENRAFMKNVYDENMKIQEETDSIMEELSGVEKSDKGDLSLSKMDVPGMLSSISLSPEQWEVIRWAINDTNMTNKQIGAILRPELSADLMREMCEVFIKGNE